MISDLPPAGPGRLVDLHCHILPGLDDGARDIGVAVAMARKAAADGVGAIVATPHVFRDGRPRWNPGDIPRACGELNGILGERGIPVEVLPGAEVHIAHDLVAEIRERRGELVLNGGPYLCVEFPADIVFPGTADLFFELMSEGITPIIAHPERNAVFQREPTRLFELVRTGALAQANAGSLTGRFGTRAGEAVAGFLKSGLVHFLATDAHHETEPGPWLSAAVRRAALLIGEERALALVREHPSAVISGRQIPGIPAAALSGNAKKPLKLRISNVLRSKR